MDQNLPQVSEKQKSVSTILWLLVIAYALLVIITTILPELSTGLTYVILIVGLPFAFALIHGKFRYGWKNILFFIFK